MTTLLLFSLLLAAPPVVHDDVYILLGGDRISGQTQQKGKTSYVVQTPYGRLTIPRSKIEKILWADGHEEKVGQPVSADVPVKLTLIVTGASFWQAWPKNFPVDPTLRLVVSLNEDVLATYVDAHLDPGDLPGATVNTFSFDPKSLSVESGEGTLAQPPETRPGRSVLKLSLPLRRAGKAQLRLAYQGNDGSSDAPAWHDIVATSAPVELKTAPQTFLEVQQDRGQMEYSGLLHKKMKNVETFKLTITTTVN